MYPVARIVALNQCDTYDLGEGEVLEVLASDYSIDCTSTSYSLHKACLYPYRCSVSTGLESPKQYAPPPPSRQKKPAVPL